MNIKIKSLIVLMDLYVPRPIKIKFEMLVHRYIYDIINNRYIDIKLDEEFIDLLKENILITRKINIVYIIQQKIKDKIDKYKNDFK